MTKLILLLLSAAAGHTLASTVGLDRGAFDPRAHFFPEAPDAVPVSYAGPKDVGFFGEVYHTPHGPGSSDRARVVP